MSYVYDQEIYYNPSRVKRWYYRRRFAVTIQALSLKTSDALLDYGMGDTHLFDLLRANIGWTGRAVGYEPVPHTYERLRQSGALSASKISVVTDTNDLQPASFDRIACLEVFEHLPDRIQYAVLEDMKRLLKPHGTIILSAPIESGFSGFAKNLVRMSLGQAHEGLTWSTAIRSLFHRPIERTEESDIAYITSHVGFQIRTLKPLFEAQGLTIKRILHSPLPLTKGLLNSQKVFVLAPSA